MTEPRVYPVVWREIDDPRWIRIVRHENDPPLLLDNAQARSIHARLGAVLGAPAPAPDKCPRCGALPPASHGGECCGDVPGTTTEDFRRLLGRARAYIEGVRSQKMLLPGHASLCRQIDAVLSGEPDPAPAPSEPLAWVVFADEDGESDLKDHEGASVDCLVFAKEKDAQDCADDGRYDDQEPRRILPLYPAAHAPDEARLKLSSRRPKVMAVAPGGEP